MSGKNASKKKKTAGASKKKQAAKERKRLVGEFAAALWNLAQVGVFFAPSADASEETHELYQNNYPLHLINFANKHFDGFGAERTEETHELYQNNYPLHLINFANKHFDGFGAERTEETTEALRRELEWRRMAPDLERIGVRLAGGIFGDDVDCAPVGT